MNAVPIGRYRFFQTIDPIYLLKSISIQSLSGCLQIFSSSGTWKIFCQQGKVIYASQSELIFEIIFPSLFKKFH